MLSHDLAAASAVERSRIHERYVTKDLRVTERRRPAIPCDVHTAKLKGSKRGQHTNDEIAVTIPGGGSDDLRRCISRRRPPAVSVDAVYRRLVGTAGGGQHRRGVRSKFGI